MPNRRPNRPQSLETLLKTTRDELLSRLIHMTAAMEAHIAADAVAFRALAEQAVQTNLDLKSLLQSRSFLRGTWFAVVTVGTLIGVVAGLVVAWYR